MKTPTLEEVKEHFKNAKEVKCLSSDRIYDLTRIKIIKDIHEWHGGYWIDAQVSVSNIKIVDECSNFAEILTYKEKSYKTPTAEEVRNHFKNAKRVKSSYSKLIFDYKEESLEFSENCFYNGSYVLWQKEKGYSEIIFYKEPLKQTVKELLKGSEFENEDWAFASENYFEFTEGIKFDHRKIKLTQQQVEDIIGYKFEIIK
jgi:hypothetical protein